MKRLLLRISYLIVVAVAVVMGSFIANAAPFLVCDPAPDAESYILVLNDGAEIATPAPLHYDLEQLAPGQYVVTAKAKQGVWVSVPSVPLDFTKPELLKPLLRIE